YDGGGGAGRQAPHAASPHGPEPQARSRLERARHRLSRQLRRDDSARLVWRVAALDDQAARQRRSAAMSAATAAGVAPAACAPGTPLYGAVVEFLYREADLLDTYRFGEWLELFAEDVRYDMPVRTNQFRADGEGFQEMAFFDETYISLKTRVKRLETE